MRGRGRRCTGVIAVFLGMLGLPAALRGQSLFIRTNQVGFLPGEVKEARILAEEDLRGTTYSIEEGDRSVYRGTIGTSVGSYGRFGFSYVVRFSDVNAPGTYHVEVRGQRSLQFVVGRKVYGGIADSLLRFFRVQRCGNSAALLHRVCHLHDATSVVEGTRVTHRAVDVTGGWHDAGDYVKFLNTTAYAAYTLLFAYEFEPSAFAGRSTPDILDEAAIGIRWLMKAHLEGGAVVSQVQDLRDHDQGWRLPEDDALALDRPAFVGRGKNLIGITSAALALAYQTWSARNPAFADSCLTLAEDLFSRRSDVPDVDASGSGMYRDLHYEGKLALGAAELYRATRNPRYLTVAKTLATKAGADYWWSWGDLNSYVHYRLASTDRGYLKYLKSNLLAAQKLSRANVFGEAAQLRWGSANAMLGVALQSLLWERVTGDHQFDTLALAQCNYVLGDNPWGVSFLSDVGERSARHFHSQVAYFNHGYLPGGLAAGPVTASTLRQYAIPFEASDPYAEFQTEGAVYRDDRMDYVTNEPTITAAATAIFVFAARSGGMLERGGGE